MAGSSGRESSAAIAKFGNGSWGVAAPVTKGIIFESDGGLTYDPEILTDDSFGQRFLGPHDVGNVNAPALSLPKPARYADFGYVLEALSMGSPASVTLSNSVVSQTASFKHIIDISPSIDGLGLTMAFDKVVHVEELTSAKVHGWDFENGDGGVMRQTFRLLGSKPTINSSVNTPGQIAAATYPAVINRIQFKHGVLRMNLNSGNTLTASDAVTIEGGKFSFNRPQDAPHVGGQDFVMEPADNGQPEFSLDVQYPRMTTASANSLRAALEAGTAWKADWTFTGVSINATDSHQFKMEWPYLQLVKWAAPTDGPRQIKPKATFAIRNPTTSPMGMPFVTPMRVTRIMPSSVHAFA